MSFNFFKICRQRGNVFTSDAYLHGSDANRHYVVNREHQLRDRRTCFVPLLETTLWFQVGFGKCAKHFDNVLDTSFV